jgi:hypothetical protein
VADDGVGAIVGIQAAHQILAVGFARQGDLRGQQLSKSSRRDSASSMRWVEDQNSSERKETSGDTRVFARLGRDAFTFHQLGNNICAMRM